MSSQSEIFTIIGKSSDNKTITLNSTLKYNHLVFSEALPNGVQYKIAAAAGLLTRNVKIIGAKYPNQIKDHFGFKMVVSGYFNITNGSNGQSYTYYQGNLIFHAIKKTF